MNKNLTALLGVLVGVIVLNVVWLNVSVLGLSKKSSEVAVDTSLTAKVSGATVAALTGTYTGGAQVGNDSGIWLNGTIRVTSTAHPGLISQFGKMVNNIWVPAGLPVGTRVTFRDCVDITSGQIGTVYDCKGKTKDIILPEIKPKVASGASDTVTQ